MFFLRLTALAVLLFPVSGFAVTDFTDDDLRKLLEQNSRTLLYSFSPSMPLSVEGLAEVRAAALDLRARVIFLLDPLEQEGALRSLPEVANILQEVRHQRSRILAERGIQLHYPSVIVIDGKQLAGPVIPGFKSRTGYVSLISDALRLPWKETFVVSRIVDLPRPINDFFKPLYGTDFVIAGYGDRGYLIHLKTKQTYEISNSDWSDPGGSPDGTFLTLLGFQGLAWYAVGDVLAGKPVLLSKDPGLSTYQSMGILPGSSTHRVLGAETSSSRPTALIFRDHATVSQEGRKTVSPLGDWRRVCTETQISIPMMSKTGLYLAGSHAGSLRVFRIGVDGAQCEEVFDTRLVTGKADFSRDDRFIVFISGGQHPETGTITDAVFLADMKENSIRPIYFAQDGGPLFFPGFVSDDRVVVYEKSSRRVIVLERGRAVER